MTMIDGVVRQDKFAVGDKVRVIINIKKIYELHNDCSFPINDGTEIIGVADVHPELHDAVGHTQFVFFKDEDVHDPKLVKLVGNRFSGAWFEKMEE